MRCQDVKAFLESEPESPLSPQVQEHLVSCLGCREAGKDLWMVRAGFRSLAQDPPPEASIGFSKRVLRRLNAPLDPANVAAEFIERIGRRVVLAGLLLTMSLLLAFALPSSSPLRSPSPDEPYLMQASNDSSAPGEVNYLADEFGDTHEAMPANLSKGSGKKQQ